MRWVNSQHVLGRQWQATNESQRTGIAGVDRIERRAMARAKNRREVRAKSLGIANHGSEWTFHVQPISVGKEGRLSAVAALHDVLRDAR